MADGGAAPDGWFGPRERRRALLRAAAKLRAHGSPHAARRVLDVAPGAGAGSPLGACLDQASARNTDSPFAPPPGEAPAG